MPLQRWFRKCTAWIALLAIGFGALAPTLSQAALAAHGQGGHWVQVCSASGITWVRADTVDTADTGEVSGEHPAEGALTCPWGVIGGGAAGLPPAHVLALPEAAPQPVPLAQPQRGPQAPASAHAPARAPPLGV
jgi:hypothetical protein